MRRIVAAVATTFTVLVLLLSHDTSTNTAAANTEAATSGATAGTVAGSTATSTQFTGEVAQTRWGPVQVAITVVGGTITAAQAVQVPSGNQRDVEFKHVAVSLLNQAVLQAQGASIDTVSGATVTSDGYVQSLQSAIDRAHL